MMRSKKTRNAVLVAIAGAIITLGLRLSLIAYPPTTDEGCYIFHAMMSQQTDEVLPTAPINFYASLASFVGYDESRPFLRFRLLDAVLASIAAALFGLLLLRWVRFWPAMIGVISFAVISCNPLFIDGGFKNPITAATMVYLAALLMLTSKNGKWCFAAGMLIPLAVMMREAFLFVPLATTLICFLIHRRRGFLLHIVGGLISAALLLLWISIYYGSPAVIVGYYLDLSQVCGDRLAELAGYSTSAIRKDAFKATFRVARWLVVPVILGGISYYWNFRHRATAYLIAVILMAVHLPEIFGKACFPYHWAQLSLGVILYATLGLHYGLLYCKLKHIRPVWIYGVCLVWVIIVGKPTLKSYRDGWILADEFAPLMIHGDWNHSVIERSFYTQTAEYLREHTSSDEKILTSGFYFALYPLANRQPPDPQFVDITFSTLAEHHKHRKNIFERMKRQRPTIVVQTLRWHVPIKEVWPDFTELYVCVKTFPVNDQQHYGRFGAKIWRLRASMKPKAKQVQVSSKK